MPREKIKEDPMHCTSFALAPILELPSITMPLHLHRALKVIYLKEKSINSNQCNKYIRCIESLSNIQTITQRDYLSILKICLYLIQFEQELTMKRYKLSNYIIKKSHENHFTIQMNSNINLREIKPNCNVTLEIMKKKIMGKVVKVIGTDVTIKINYSPNLEMRDRQKQILEDETKRFNIEFWNSHWPLKCCHYALSIISKCNWNEIVYPQLKTNFTDMESDIQWINTEMKENKEQQQAVRKILNKTANPAPYIIFGPPGTGKTATLVETICQIVRHFPTKNILVCTVSNAAADEIAKRLIRIIPPNLIYRMYTPSKLWATVNKTIQSCVNFEGNTTIFLSKELLLLKKIVITTLVSCTRLTNLNFRENHFSYIIIDEASQATEPEMLIPLALMKKTEDQEDKGFQAQIVIAGDPYQLGPVILNKRIEHLLEKSILQRLMNDCDPYKTQDGKYNPNYITKLIKNYRSHEVLLHVSNEKFYRGELEICGGANTRMALNWSQLPNKKFPIIFQEVLGTEERSITQSVSNMAEILAVLMYVDMLIKTKFGKQTVAPKDIGIITPFKQQQINITHHLAAMKLKDITVGTVETFQGQERNVMIVSTVRSKIFEHNDKEHIGLLSNPKRFNVAITRAKALMIIIGNPKILCTDEHWEVLWKYCKEHNACIPFEKLPLNKNIITKLKGDFKVESCNSSGASNARGLSVKFKKKEEKTTFDVLLRKMANLKLKGE